MSTRTKDALLSSKGLALFFTGSAFIFSGLTYAFGAILDNPVNYVALTALAINVCAWALDFINRHEKSSQHYKLGKWILLCYGAVFLVYFVWYISHMSHSQHVPAPVTTVLRYILGTLSLISAYWKFRQIGKVIV